MELPIDSLSYSRIRSYLGNKMQFWRYYVTKDHLPSRTGTMVEGSIIHRMAEFMAIDAMTEKQGTEIRSFDESGAGEALREYIEEEYPTITYQNATKLTEEHVYKHGVHIAPTFQKQLNKWLKKHHAFFTHIEYGMKAFVKDSSGVSFPIPFVARVDALTKHRDPVTGKDIVTIHDWKMVRSTKDETIQKNQFIYAFQAIPYYLVAREEFPGCEIRVMYHFFKTTESKATKKKGATVMPPYVAYEVPPISDQEIQSFCYLVELMLKDMRGLQGPSEGPILLPDVFNDVSGQKNWQLFQEYYQSFI